MPYNVDTKMQSDMLGRALEDYEAEEAENREMALYVAHLDRQKRELAHSVYFATGIMFAVILTILCLAH